jgi:outer membrane lipoprotein-sorting protein
MNLRKLFYFSAASVLAAGLAVPASAQFFGGQNRQSAPPPAKTRPAPVHIRPSAPVAQTVPYPLPRPAALSSEAATVVPAPVAGIPAAFAAQAPAQTPSALTPPTEQAVEPVVVPVQASAPLPAAVEAMPVAAPASEPPPVPAEAEAAPQDPGAPLDLAAPQPEPTTIAVATAAGPPTEQQTLSKVNTYFNGIKTLVGNFTQVGPDGSKADGKFFLQKPGKVRFYYQRPSTTDIIADGKSLVVRDRKLATQDVYPLGQTPLKFLLDNNLDLSRDSKVVAVYEEPGLVSVAIEEDTTFGGKARVLIVFGTQDQKNFELKQWTITDPQGLDTTVAVSELDTSTKPDEKLFAVDYKREITRN